MDFYDPDIEEKLKKLEEEEDKLLEMERNENELMDDGSEDSDGVTEEDLRRSLKEVRSKKAILKLQHKMKKNLRARSKNKKLEDLEEHLEKKGIEANIDNIRNRIKQRKTIKELEANQDKLNKKAFEDSDDSGDEKMLEDGDRRGRKRKRSLSDSDDDEEMKDSRGPSKKTDGGKRSMTPMQLKIRSQSKLRSMSQGRREGSKPQYHPTRVVPEEHIRLAKKINKRFKHSINVNEADRVISVKKPKHLYSGKRGIGKNDRR
jgi:nucleolar GTP-binding protein